MKIRIIKDTQVCFPVWWPGWVRTRLKMNYYLILSPGTQGGGKFFANNFSIHRGEPSGKEVEGPYRILGVMGAPE